MQKPAYLCIYFLKCNNMVRENLVKILLVDDVQITLDSLMEAIPETLNHMDVSVDAYKPPKGCTEDSVIQEICERKFDDERGFDILLMDYRFKNASFNGADVGKKIKERYPDRKVVLISEYEVIPAAGLDGICVKDDVLSVINNYLFRPIDVGIVGYGRFGDALLRQLLGLEEVRKIYLSSDKLFAGFTDEQFFDGIEQVRKTSKVAAPCKLEEVCEKSDVIAYCSSTLSGDRVVFLANSTLPFQKDRRTIFPTERNTFNNFFKVYNKSENKPLILIFSNPPPYLIRMGLLQGIPKEKVTCTCEPDLSRFIASLPQHLLEKEVEFSKAAEALLTGVHGDPRLAYALKYQDLMGKHSSELDAALEKSVQMANRAARARYGIGRAPDIPSLSNVHFFKDFSRYRSSMGNFHLFREFKYRGATYEGVALYPARVNYHGGVSSVLNEEKIEEIGMQEFNKANAAYLAEQTSLFESTMRLPAPANAKEDVLHLEELGFSFSPYKAEVLRKLQRMR